MDEKTRKSNTKYIIAGIAILLVGTMLGSVFGIVASGIYFTNKFDEMSKDIVSQADESSRSLVDEETGKVDEKITDLEGTLKEYQDKVGTIEDKMSEMDKDIETAKELPEIPDVTVTDGYSETVETIAQKALPSVVGVRTIQTVTGLFRGSYDVEGIGTGVIVSSDGIILTNQHVVTSNPKSVTVTLIDGTEHDATVLYTDEVMDLAIIKIDAAGLTPAELGDSDSLSVGEMAVAIGNPLGLEYQRSVTAGIISALNRSLQISSTQISENLIQTDAAINSGNSGGPLLNSDGQVIGINTYKDMQGEALGFAIPINVAVPFINQILETGTYKGVQLGVVILDRVILSYFTDNQGIVIDKGIYIYKLKEGSDAEAKGLQVGDIILSIDGTEVNTNTEFRSLLGNYLPGDTVTLNVLRDGSTFDLNVVLDSD